MEENWSMFEASKENKKILVSFEFEPGKVEKGYTDRRLYINLSENKIEEKPIDLQVKETFTGGRGYGIWYLWDAVSSNTKWNDPENEIIFCTGPICGVTQYSGTGKTHIVTLSPQTLPIDQAESKIKLAKTIILAPSIKAS
ncbi:unnamed protein product [marine sediment metagenome]|uniref:Aldehyde ferredoxin oxidoreductase N-terminal domain-containing protein n=1 Tax=marine sediment metagenome TaxID=412755 RepID=X1AM75_9ZZZZ